MFSEWPLRLLPPLGFKGVFHHKFLDIISMSVKFCDKNDWFFEENSVEMTIIWVKIENQTIIICIKSIHDYNYCIMTNSPWLLICEQTKYHILYDRKNYIR